jgi:transmembrane sensor
MPKNRMKDAPYIELIGSYLSGNIDAESRRELMDWVAAHPDNQAFFDEMVQLWDISATEPAPFTTDVAAAWQKVEDRIEVKTTATPEATVIRMNWTRTILRIAAVVALTVGAYWWFNSRATLEEPTMVAQTMTDQQEEVTLPDGSTVWLNANTHFEYTDGADTRTVKLIGEAFFEVAKNPERPFVIETQHTTTRVLGTSFNIRAYPEEKTTEIIVATGLVAFQAAEKEETLQLEPGKAGVFDESTAQLALKEADVANAKAWQTKTLRFADTKMNNVREVLERYYHKTIIIENEAILDCRFSGTYDQPELQTLIEIMEFSMNLNIQVVNDTIRVSGEGCAE